MAMGKSGMGLLAVICSIIAILIVFSAAGHSKAAYDNDNEKITDSLLSEMNMAGSGERLPVIITLKKGKDGRKVEARAGIRDNVKHRYKSFPGLSANVTRDELAGLAQDPDVEGIEPVRLLKASAIPDIEPNIGVIRANDTWQIMLGQQNITGKGTSVCVIDTGVDYTHPDLGGCTTAQFKSGNCSKVIAGHDYVNNDTDPMDDNGHGTHVAGIVAANGQFAGGSSGGLIGVAPDAKIVAMKVLDYDGFGFSDDLDAAIEWCVSNASKFNITAISMSLGATSCSIPKSCYSSYCDYEALSTSAAINSAVAADIYVVISTGNAGKNNSVSYPACIRNAIRVGATNNNDAFVGFTNRGPGFPDMLLAPGSGVNSTYPSGGYATMGGTSMATPHVSGAIALFSQFYTSAYGFAVQPSYLWFILNSTGKPIQDDITATGLMFSRVDAFGALDGLIAPRWSNGSSSAVTSYSPFLVSSFNITWEDDRLAYALIEGNWSNQSRNYTMLTSDSGETRTYQYNVTLPAGSFYWRSWAMDTSGNWNRSDAWNFSVARANTTITLLLNGAPGNTSVDQDNIVNITVMVNSIGSLALIVNGSASNHSINNSDTGVESLTAFPEPGMFGVAASFSENQNYTSASAASWIEVNDTLPPAIANASVMPYLVRDGDNITISAHASDYSIGSVWYEIKDSNSTNVTNSSGPVALGMMQNANGTLFKAMHTIMLPEGNYAVSVHANDTRGHQANATAGVFMVAPYINFSIRFFGHDGNSSNITRFSILYNGSDIVRNQSSMSDGFDGILLAGLWDILLETEAFNASLMEVNISQDGGWVIDADWDMNESGMGLPSGARSFYNIIAVDTNITFGRANISMGFNASGSANRSHLSVFVCHDWNMSGRDCYGVWENASTNATFDLARNVTSVGAAGLSAFAVAQDKYCGDGICDSSGADTYSESCSTCSADCGSCPKPPSEDGGGRSSGGSGSYSPPISGLDAAEGGNASETGAGYNLTVTEFDCISGERQCSGDHTMECVENVWALSNECQYGCEGGECMQPDGQGLTCVPDEARCEGDTAQICDPAGSGWIDLSSCAFGCSEGECLGLVGMITGRAVEIMPILPALVIVLGAAYLVIVRRKR
jgi:subtilisin family serine protease